MNNLVLKQIPTSSAFWTPLATETEVLSGTVFVEDAGIVMRVGASGVPVPFDRGASFEIKRVDLSTIEVFGTGATVVFAGGTWV